MSTPSEVNKVKSHCNQCGGSTSHDVVHTESFLHEYGAGDDYLKFATQNEYQILRCRGCEWVSLRHKEWFAGPPSEPRVGYYPPLISRKKPQWIFQGWAAGTIPGTAHSLLNEIYSALHMGSYRISAMGIRSLIEHIMTEKVGDQGGFVRTVEEFHKQGWLSMKQKETLAKIIDAGHAATHRNFVPTPEDIETLMDITEALVANVYVHPERGAQLGCRVPPRKR